MLYLSNVKHLYLLQVKLEIRIERGGKLVEIFFINAWVGDTQAIYVESRS